LVDACFKPVSNIAIQKVASSWSVQGRAKKAGGLRHKSMQLASVTVITARMLRRCDDALVSFASEVPSAKPQSIGKPVPRRLEMDRSIEWPWSWEEEAEWKADLEDREHSGLEGLIDFEELIESAVVGDVTH
jgi:hypothetical protein